jgi:hypothetical protein
MLREVKPLGYSRFDYLEHPDITAIRNYGYPLNHLPVEQWCEECGREIEDEVYEDEDHKSLCVNCLLSLHKKGLYE